MTIQAAIVEPRRRFNCTFMELKSDNENEDDNKKACFNCTFMELKLEIRDTVSIHTGF